MAVFIKREYDYAIRIVAYLAGYLESRELKSISEISRRLFIPKAFATKILHQLKNARVVDTVQGRLGGIRLNSPPQEISVLDVLNAMNFDSTLNECIKKPSICPLISICNIHMFFVDLENSLLDSFADKKISDFAFTNEKLIKYNSSKSENL